MENTYFAAANSGQGFVSDYGTLFGTAGLGRLYLIKGGPGTGKSTLLRRAAAYAEERGLPVRRYACSSDPDSLDGIMVGDGRLAMIDATPPHGRELELPGAADELIDLGQFWDSRLLSANREEIRQYNQTKKAAYARAYQWLSAAASVNRAMLAMLEDCLDLPKLRGEVRRRLAGLPAGEGREIPARVSAVGMKGSVTLPTMHRGADRAYILTETRGGGGLFLREVLRAVADKKADAEFALIPLDPAWAEGVFLPGLGTAFLDEGAAETPRPQDKLIRMSRFYRPAELRANRHELRQAAHSKEMLMEGASAAFEDARCAHFALEEIYADAMDYSALERFCAALIPRIFADEVF